MYRMERDSFDGPNEAAEMHRKAFNLGNNRAFSVEMCFENESVRSKVMPRNVGVGLKDRGWADRKAWAGVVPRGCPWRKMTLHIS